MTEPHERGSARLMALCAENPVPTVLLALALAVAGGAAVLHTPLDAVPDLSDVQVVVLTEWPGQSTELVEDQLTYPISAALLGAPRVQAVRGQSFFGVSFVYVVFEEGTDLYWARSRVLESMSSVRARLPAGVNPVLGPDASGVGWVFQYALVDDSGRLDLAELRALQDWRVRYALASVPGVAEVATVGGREKQYEVVVDPARLLAHGLSLHQLIEAVRASNVDGGGRALEIAGHRHMIRSRGYLRGTADLEQIPVARPPGRAPVLLAEVADVSVGAAMAQGIAELDGRGEVVGGIVVMRDGENALDVIRAVKARLAALAPGLPDGVRVEVVYDRAELIEAAVDTLRRTLLEELLVVSLIVLLFLLHARSALVVVLTLPVAVLAAFLPMLLQGLTANIMSLGGIAVAVGALVDGSIIVVENVHRRLGEAGDEDDRSAVVVRAMQEVGPSIFFSLLVITVSFLPVFTLGAVEGRLFRPLAFTKTWSMAFGALLAITLTPALVALLVRGRARPEGAHPVNRFITRAYAPVVRAAVDRSGVVIGGAALLVLATVPVFFALESEFVPPLNEGSLLNMPSAPPGMSITEAGNALQASSRALREVPEVARVFGKIGRAETATDPAPLSMIETTVLLKPRDQWRPGLSWDDLVEELDGAVQIPGMPNLWWMPIQTRTEMLATGVRSPLAVQVFGDSAEDIEAAAVKIERALRALPQTRSAFAERPAGGLYIDVELDRARAAQHGVRARDLADVVAAAVGGRVVTHTLEGRARFPVNVRYARALRDDPEELGRALVSAPGGAQIPISQVARIRHRAGPSMIRSEDGQRVGFVFVDPGDTSARDYVAAADEVLAGLDLDGVRVAWTGEHEHLARAASRLAIVIPLTLLLVFLLLWANTRSLGETGIVLLAVPFSLVGAVWFMWLLGYKLSVASAVGFVALAGLDAETGVVMLLYLRLAWRRRAEAGELETSAQRREAVVEGAADRIRPKLMTVLCLGLGLLPLLWSDGAGADVMKRVAAPVVGGLVTSFLLELIVYPAVFSRWKSRGP